MSLTVLEGMRPWILQRLTAVVMAGYIIYAIICLATLEQASYEAWYNWIYQPWNSLLLGLFALSLLFHAWIGMRDVVLDYVHPVMLRLTILSAIVLMLLFCGLWVLRIVLVPLAGQVD